jgi:hypothetical protein
MQRSFFTVAYIIALTSISAYAFVAVVVDTRPSSLALGEHRSRRLYATSRRDLFGVLVAAPILEALSFSSSVPTAFAADVDYSKIQDLLGPGGGDYVVPYQAPESGKRPTWLTEPTAEFKESELKATEFKRKNLQVSKQFLTLLETIATAPNNEDVLANALDEIRRLVKANQGLPIGITKEEIIKTCRRRKSKKYWPTQVEVAYVLYVSP